MMKFLAFAAMGLLFVSCASLSEKASKLKVTELKDDVNGCTKVAHVQGAVFGNPTDPVANHNAKVKMMNLAAEHGDTLLMTKDEMGLFGSDKEGVVYKCLN